MNKDDFLQSLNTSSVSINEQNEVRINNVYMPNVHVECIEHIKNGTAHRVIEYNNVFYKQNGYYENIRGHAQGYYFGEQFWVEVKVEKRVAYEYV